jgi:hypothetical protein
MVFDMAKARIRKFKAFGCTVSLKYDRVKLMADSPCCNWPGCKRKVSYFWIEQHHGANHACCMPYTKKGNNESIMTLDHTVARSLGWADTSDNMQVMCSIHNQEKARTENYLAKHKVRLAISQ